MQTAPVVLQPTSDLSKLDRDAQVRHVWYAAYRQARAQIRDRHTSTAATAYVWALDHLRRRFGSAGWNVAQAAAGLVLARRIVSGAAVGSIADLERQGLIRATAKPRRGNLVGMVAYRCITPE